MGKIDKLKFELSLCDPRDSEDALQEATLAELEGRNPVAAVQCFRKRQQKYRQMERPFTDLGILHQ